MRPITTQTIPTPAKVNAEETLRPERRRIVIERAKQNATTLLALVAMVLAPAILDSSLLNAQSTPSPSLCKAWDDRFGFLFDWGALVIGGLLSGAVLPFIVPPLFGYRWWFLTRPLLRWLVICSLSTLFLGFVFIALPALANQSWLSPDLGLIIYTLFGVDPQYLACNSPAVSLNSLGILFGQLGSSRAPVFLLAPLMVAVLVCAVGLWSIFYWGFYYLVRWRVGLQAMVASKEL